MFLLHILVFFFDIQVVIFTFSHCSKSSFSVQNFIYFLQFFAPKKYWIFANKNRMFMPPIIIILFNSRICDFLDRKLNFITVCWFPDFLFNKFAMSRCHVSWRNVNRQILKKSIRNVIITIRLQPLKFKFRKPSLILQKVPFLWNSLQSLEFSLVWSSHYF